MSTIIQATLDYSLFHRINSNRDINRTHLNRLKNSISGKNYLYLFPIIINKDMEIVDGQHRLTEAMELKLPIFYIIDDKITKAEIAMVNSNRRGWNPTDYMEYYAKEGREDYKKLLDILKKWRVQKIAAATLITDNVSGGASGGSTASYLVKSGDINSNHYALAIKILTFAHSLNNDFEFSMKREFLIPLKNICLKATIPTEDVFKKIKKDLPKDFEKLDLYLHTLKVELCKSASKTIPQKPIKPYPRKASQFHKNDKKVLDMHDFSKEEMF